MSCQDVIMYTSINYDPTGIIHATYYIMIHDSRAVDDSRHKSSEIKKILFVILIFVDIMSTNNKVI